MAHSQVLVEDYQKYVGQYVTTNSFDSKAVCTHSASAKEAYQQALDQGIIDPVIIYVPTEQDVACRHYVRR